MATETQPQPQYSERDLEFLRSRPGVEKDPRLPVVAQAFAATLGHATDEYYAALDHAFPVARTEPNPEVSEPPRIDPPKAVVPQQQQTHYSAPPTRETASWSNGKPASENRVTLTAQDRELAAMWGLSEKEYLVAKERVAREKAAGFHNEQR
jgi:hypothetical protein